MFGTKCSACNKFVEGEVVTALGSTYHQKCFVCARCRQPFPTGEKVTFTGKECLCAKCIQIPVVNSAAPESPTNLTRITCTGTRNRSTLDPCRSVIVLEPSNGGGYCSWMNLVYVCRGMTAVNWYFCDLENAMNQPIPLSVKPVLHPGYQGLGLLNAAPNTIFQQDNARPHVAPRTNSLTGFDILPWQANSPDLNPIVHLWDLIGRDMNRGPLAQTVDDLLQRYSTCGPHVAHRIFLSGPVMSRCNNKLNYLRTMH
ncbi:actin-binding LIM protein 2 [Trichonephila clavipes]|nr:actin-binding LIM protein 2 [Trichonephila clavipes]